MAGITTLRNLAARSIRTAAPYGRQLAEASMTCEVVITRDGARPVWNAAARTATIGAGIEVYTGPANIQTDVSATEVVIGDAPLRLGSLVATIPFDAPLPEVDDVLTVIASPDDALLTGGNAYRITSVSRGGMVPTSRRLILETFESSVQRPLP